MSRVTSCSIACGGHAGDRKSMARALIGARQYGLAAGAHPAYPDREGFGRRRYDGPRAGLRDILARQIDTLQEEAARAGQDLAHLKAHGTLYHDSADDPELAALLVELAADQPVPLTIYGPAHANLLCEAVRQAGLVYVAEGFADRTYQRDGRLLPRTAPDSVIHDSTQSAGQAVRLVRDRQAIAGCGTPIELSVQTLCIHGDTPGALSAAQAIRARLEAAGIEIRAPGKARDD